MLGEFLSLVLKGIRHRPVRSWLTILGIVIGIMLVVSILSLGEGIKNTVTQMLQMFGSDLMIIFPGKETNPLIGFLGGQKFRESDLMALENIPGVRFVAPMERASLNVEYKGEKEVVLIHGVFLTAMKQILETSQGIKLEQGRWPLNEQSREAVLGYNIFHKTFDKKVRIGDEITIKAKKMKIVGYISEIGNEVDDNTIWVSLGVFRELTGSRGGANSALVKVKPGYNVDLVAEQIRFQLSKQEVVKDFAVFTPEKANRLIGNVLSVIEVGLLIIAFISLIVGAVGIMNTMYTSVLERTRQIGIMKAIGASGDDIMVLFLLESGMIGLVGGILGIILGVAIAFVLGLVAAQFGIKGLFSFASLDYFGFLAILLITFITGVLAGVLPARQAAKLEPAEALRYE